MGILFRRLAPAVLLLSLAVTARATVYTLSQQGLLSLDVLESSAFPNASVSVIKTPVAGGVEYLVTFTNNSGFFARNWSYITSGKGLLTGLPIQSGDSLALQYTLLSSTLPGGVVQVGPAIDNASGSFEVGSARLGGANGNSGVSIVTTNKTGTTSYVGSFLYLIPPDLNTWPATGGQVRIRVTPAAGATVLGPAAGPLYLSTTELRFGARGAIATGAQQVLVNAANSGVNWSVTASQPWITLSRTSGTGSTSFNVSVNPAGQAGQLTGEVTVTPAGAPAQTIQVHLSMLNTSTPPIGVIDTPANGAVVQGALGVTGWAVDDIEVVRVMIFRAPVAGEPPSGDPNGVYIGDALFIAGARPDVAGIYAGYPLRERAGWGLQVLTNMLPNTTGSGFRGDGTYTLRAVAVDAEGNAVVLGERSITATNSTATKPFGTLDTPTPGEVVSGTKAVWGWALTPGAAKIPEDGSTIRVYVDGHAAGYLTVPGGQYNLSRADIVALFPGYTNTNGAVGVFYLNTRTLTNGMHNIAWSVTDNQGRVDGIGSRYFFVQN